MAINFLSLFLHPINHKTISQLETVIMTLSQLRCLAISRSISLKLNNIWFSKRLSDVSDPSPLMPSNFTITPSDTVSTISVSIVTNHLLCLIIFPLHLNLSIRDLRRIMNTLDSTNAQTILLRLSFIPR